MRRAGSLIIVTALVAAVALGACGAESSGGDVSVSAEEQPYVDAMAASMTAEEPAEPAEPGSFESSDDSATSDFELTDEQAGCISSRFVDIITVERLEKAGIEPEDLSAPDAAFDLSELGLSEDDGNRLYDTFEACGFNLRDEMTKAFAEGDDEVNPQMQACLEGVFTEENLRTLMVTAIVKGDDAMEDDPALAPIMGTMMGCAFMGMEDMDLGTEGPDGGN